MPSALRGKIILVTRPREQAQELVAEIERCGANAVLVPMIRIVDPESWSKCDAAIDTLATYDGMIFTSGNAAANFFRRCEQKHRFAREFAGIKMFAVGAKTAELLQAHGVAASIVPSEFSADALLGSLPLEHLRGKRILFPKGNLTASDLAMHLRAKGIVVDEIEVYRNAPEPLEEIRQVAERLARREFDVVTFASPSAVRSFGRVVSPGRVSMIHDQTKIAVIGPTTKSAAQALGFTVDIVAEQATSKGLVDAIAAFYAVKPTIENTRQ